MQGLRTVVGQFAGVSLALWWSPAWVLNARVQLCALLPCRWFHGQTQLSCHSHKGQLLLLVGSDSAVVTEVELAFMMIHDGH